MIKFRVVESEREQNFDVDDRWGLWRHETLEEYLSTQVLEQDALS